MKNRSNSYPSGPKRGLALFSQIKYEHLLAGISGGAISTLILHPLDLMKIRFAVSDGSAKIPQYNSLTSAFCTVFLNKKALKVYIKVLPLMSGDLEVLGVVTSCSIIQLKRGYKLVMLNNSWDLPFICLLHQRPAS